MSNVAPNGTHLAANATTVLKSGPGKLYGVFVNKAGAAANIITIYDNTAASGTVLAIIDSTVAAAPSRMYNLTFGTGLTVVMGTGTAADITVTWE